MTRYRDHHRCVSFHNGWSFGKNQWLYTPAVRSSDVVASIDRQLSAWLRTQLDHQTAEYAGITDAIHTAKIRDWHARLMLLLNSDDLFVSKTGTPHSLVLATGQSLLHQWIMSAGQVLIVKSVSRYDCLYYLSASSVRISSVCSPKRGDRRSVFKTASENFNGVRKPGTV